MEICFGCMYRFDILEQAATGPSLSEEIDQQNASLAHWGSQPRSASSADMGRIGIPLPDAGTPAQDCHKGAALGKATPAHPVLLPLEGFQTEYQLVISLKPLTPDTPQPPDIQPADTPQSAPCT
jgi:hypothetical protein